MRLISNGSGGSLHDACKLYNQLGLADYVIVMQPTDGSTTTVFKVPDEKVPAVWRLLGKNMALCPIQLNEQGRPK